MTATTTAEKMDRQYRFQRHIYDATRTHYLFWRRRLIEDLRPPANAAIVEIACGTGWNIVRAAQTYPHAQFFGFDISNEMLRTAKSAIERNGYANRVKLAHGDATHFDLAAVFGLPCADRIFISYALSMIPDWPAAVDCAARSLTPNGALHVVDFGRLENMPAPAKFAFLKFLNHYNVTPRRDLEAVLRAAAKRHGLSLSFDEMRSGYTAYAVLRR